MHPLHERHELIVVAEVSKRDLVRVREGQGTPHRKSLGAYRRLEVIAWEFVDIFEVVALQRAAPRLVKRIGEPAALEYNLDKIIERAEGINAHLGELERWRVGGWYNDGAKCLH